MITLRKRLAGPRGRHMLFPAVLFLLLAAGSVAASKAAHTLRVPGASISAVELPGVELTERDGI